VCDSSVIPRIFCESDFARWYYLRTCIAELSETRGTHRVLILRFIFVIYYFARVMIHLLSYVHMFVFVFTFDYTFVCVIPACAISSHVLRYRCFGFPDAPCALFNLFIPISFASRLRTFLHLRRQASSRWISSSKTYLPPGRRPKEIIYMNIRHVLIIQNAFSHISFSLNVRLARVG